ncbi:hypothetical protein [Pseudomonas aeruginosa]
MRIPPYFPRLGALALACALALPAQAAERAWSYSYNALGLIERADGPRTDVQDVTLYAYDSRGNLTQVTNALGQVTRLGDYDERGKPGSITDANGVTSSLAYTGVDGWLASVSTAGSTTRFDYDAVGQITRVTRGDGSWLSYEYDDARRLVAIGNNLGERLEYDVDTKGNRTAQRIKDASGSLVRQQQWAYDELGRLLRAVGAGGQTRSFAYDLNDNPVGETNPRQFAHSQAFDALDRLVGQSDPLGGKTQLAYDAQDNLTEVSWLASVSTAGSTTRFDYDAVGQITRVTRGDGSWLSYEYDDARRLVAIGNNLGERLEYDVDTKGNRTAQRIKDASGSLVRQQQWAYDELGRLLRAVGAGGQTRSFAYDLNDNPVGETNPRQFAHSQAFDALDRLVGQSDPLGGKTQLAYDAQDNLTEVKDPRGVTTRYEYDGLGNLTRLVSPDSGTTTFEHDAAGNVIRRTDARGAVTEYRYDALNRLIERHSPSDPSLDVQYRYDLTADGNKGIGRLGAIEGARDSLVYRYDERGNLVEQVRSIRLDQQTLLDRVTYRYDAANQLLEIGYPSGLAIGYPRNAGGQVASVTLAVGDKAPSTLVGQIAYLPFGPLPNTATTPSASASSSSPPRASPPTSTVPTASCSAKPNTKGAEHPGRADRLPALRPAAAPDLGQRHHSQPRVRPGLPTAAAEGRPLAERLPARCQWQYPAAPPQPLGHPGLPVRPAGPPDRGTRRPGRAQLRLRRGRQPHPTQRQPRLRRHRQQPGLPVLARQQPIDRHRRASGDQRRRRQPHPGPRRAQTGLRRPGPPAKRQPRRPAGRRIPLQRPRPAHRQAHPREHHHLPLRSRRPVARRSRTRRQRPETASPVLPVAGQPAAGHHRRRLRRPGQGRQPDPALPPWRPPRHPAPGYRRQRPDRLAVAVRRLRPRRSAEPGQHPGQPALPRAVLRCGERAALQLLPRL